MGHAVGCDADVVQVNEPGRCNRFLSAARGWGVRRIGALVEDNCQASDVMLVGSETVCVSVHQPCVVGPLCPFSVCCAALQPKNNVLLAPVLSCSTTSQRGAPAPQWPSSR